jgi:outer membrane receptor for ferrienterochelin and colicins
LREYGDFELFIGFTFTDTKIHDGGAAVQNPITAKYKLSNVLMYEAEEKWKVGWELINISTHQSMVL